MHVSSQVFFTIHKDEPGLALINCKGKLTWNMHKSCQGLLELSCWAVSWHVQNRLSLAFFIDWRLVPLDPFFSTNLSFFFSIALLMLLDISWPHACKCESCNKQITTTWRFKMHTASRNGLGKHCTLIADNLKCMHDIVNIDGDNDNWKMATYCCHEKHISPIIRMPLLDMIQHLLINGIFSSSLPLNLVIDSWLEFKSKLDLGSWSRPSLTITLYWNGCRQKIIYSIIYIFNLLRTLRLSTGLCRSGFELRLTWNKCLDLYFSR